MTRAARVAYLVLAWAFLAGLVIQVFAIGLALFGGTSTELHVNLGWILHLAPLLVLLAAWLARAGRRHWVAALALAAVVFVVPILVLARDGLPAIAALHPVAAVIAFWLAVVVARNSLEAVRAPDDEASSDGVQA
jgi:hypothetical protein